MKSAVYAGVLSHRRHFPVSHAFQYNVFMMYLDLEEIPTLFLGHRLWSARRWAPAQWRRKDFLGHPDLPLDEAVRARVAQQSGMKPNGPIRMLTNLRYWGLTMNPVTFYYCFDEADERVVALVAEITNTPWRERHCYVLLAGDPDGTASLEASFPKDFHVSPFMPMAQTYRWRFNHPSTHLTVAMRSTEGDREVFEADLHLTRREISHRELTAVLWRFPFMTLQVVAGIYFQALRLWSKGMPFFAHPAKAPQ